MTEKYQVNFLSDGTLIKQFEITEREPKRDIVPDGWKQVILDDTEKEKFDFLVAQYQLHNRKVKFNIDCTINHIEE
jgi:hypothetical protein